MLELNEITSHIMLSQMSASSSFAEGLGQPQLSRNADSSAAVQIDECLTKLEKTFPPLMSFDPVQDDSDNGSKRRQILLRLR